MFNLSLFALIAKPLNKVQFKLVLPEIDDEYSEEALFAEVQAKINEGKIPEGAKVAFEEGGMDEFFKWKTKLSGYEGETGATGTADAQPGGATAPKLASSDDLRKSLPPGFAPRAKPIAMSQSQRRALHQSGRRVEGLRGRKERQQSELGVHLRRGWVEGYSAELSGRADKIVRRERAAKVRVCALRAHHDNLSPEMRAR